MKLIFSLLFSMVFLQGMATKIEGRHKDYAGMELVFFRYNNPVSLEKEHVFTLKVDATGAFSADVKAEETIFVFSDFGIYRGMLFLEPGKTVQLQLPPLRKKSFAEEKNPYFQPVGFWFATGKNDQLNDKVAAFDAMLNQLTDKYFNQLYFSQSKKAFDSIQYAADQKFGKEASPVLQHHIKLKLKAVEADAFRLSPAKVSPALQASTPAYHTHPAFTELLEKAYSGRLSFEAKSVNGDEIRKAVAGNNISFLQNLLKTKYEITGTAADIVLLKMLHDAFYSGDFTRQSVLQMVQARHFKQHPDQYIRKTAAGVASKLEHLQQGTKAPVICLENTAGKKTCTNETTGKYKYILFADTEMIVVKEQLKYLTKTAEQFDKHLEIFVILRNAETNAMKKFLEEEKIPGLHLIDKNGEYAEKYRVKSYPAAFLLNEKHEVVFQETKAPLDGFELQFGPYLRNELFRRQGNQSR
jgi:peroxiredoxin